MLAPPVAKSKLNAALDAARRGFSVFPLVPNTKRPAVERWQFAATRDEGRITAWWTENPDYNVGSPMNNKLAMDIDPRNGGAASIKALSETETIVKTLSTKTQSGGHHLIYELPPGVHVSNSKDRFGPGIDIKTGPGAYLVMPGSTIDGRSYEWVKKPEEGFPDGRPVAQAPAWVLAKASGPKVSKSTAAGKRLVEEDDDAIALATKWLEGAPEAAAGNRDNTAFQVAAKLYDFGVSKATALDLLHQWNDAKCAPPLEIEEIERIADSGGRNRSKPIGVNHPDNASGFEAVEIEPGTQGPSRAPEFEKEKRSKFYWISAAECAKTALENPREWLIENVLHCGAEGVVIGGPGEGKSFGLIDLGFNVSRGTPWAGNPTRQCGVVYIAAEAQEGIKTRLAALEKQYGPIGDAPFDIIPVAPDLAHGLGDARELVQKIHEIEAQRQCKTGLFIIDTLNRAIAGGDESSSKDMGSVINATRLIRAETGAASIVVHHPGWKGDRARGHSSLFGAVDTEIQVKNRVMTVTKLRDGTTGLGVPFRLVPVTIGPGPGGRTTTSCYFEARENSGFDGPVDITAEQWEWFVQIADAARGQPFGVRPLARKLSMAHTTLIKRLDALVPTGWIEQIGGGKYGTNIAGFVSE